ncbi:TolC family protein [Desulfoluna sp.]|uniref:TolC family protein n=1 Tax=Desulfoluna sp. TaxID=2045199 RepID=UPI002617B7D7|nr:TolC family protein [Desulfoluna sp.]
MPRRRQKGPAPLAWGVLFLALICLGCGLRNRHSVIQEADKAVIQELMAPFYSGQQHLFETLGTTAHDLIVFQLKNQRVKRVLEPESLPRFLADELIVFFRITDPDQGETALYYFDPLSLRLSRLPLSEFSSESTQTFAVFKALARERWGWPGEQALSLVSLHFDYDGSGTLRFAGKKRVKGIPGEPVLPVYLRRSGCVFFLSRDSQGASLLMAVDEQGENLGEPLGPGYGEITRIFSDDDRTLVFESDKKGYQSLYRLTPETGEVTGYHRSEAFEGEGSRYILRRRHAHGVAPPVVVRLPEVLDVQAIVSLVMAQSPEVNLKRSLWAADFVQAGIATLPNYPSLYFELGTSSAAGLFSDQSGFFIDGLLGIFQPLLDIRRNTELWRAAQLTAETSRCRVDDEINERVAEALQLYFKVSHLQELGDVQEALLSTYQRRVTYYETLKSVGDALGGQRLAAEKILVSGRAERAHTHRQIVFLMRRLKDLCGIPQGVGISLTPADFHLEDMVFEAPGVLRELSVLNHPQVKAISSEFQKARFLESAGPEIRGTLNASAEYEYRGRSTGDAVTDNINLTLSGGVSTAHRKAARLHRHYWSHMKESLRLRLEIVSDQIQLGLDEALMDFKAAQGDALAKRRDAHYYLEKVRVARLYEAIDSIDEEGPLDPLAVNTAEQAYFEAVARLAGVKKDLGVRYANVWRETGRSRLLGEQLTALSFQNIDRQSASLWLWETRAAMDSSAHRAAFVKTARSAGVKRVYAYLYSDARLLSEQMAREQLTQFLGDCAREGIEVWALLGEPEWLTGDDGLEALTRGIDRIASFNGSKNRFEPRISGVKLDVEPHSIAGWETEPIRRMALNRTYIRLIQRARARIGVEMPLWVDCPVKFFTREEHRPLMRQVARLTDGITVMAYFDAPEKIDRIATAVLEAAEGPVEVGVEFSHRAPATDTLYPLARDRWPQVVEPLAGQFMESPFYRGLSYHDYSALRLIFDGGGD